MTLFDTNVLIYASDPASGHYDWARRCIADAVAADGAAINAVAIAEICVGDAQPERASDTIRSWGVVVLDVPAAAAEAGARAYRAYREQRSLRSDRESTLTPLPDFFIGAHAETMGWDLATADDRRFKTYFPSVRLVTPRD